MVSYGPWEDSFSRGEGVFWFPPARPGFMGKSRPNLPFQEKVKVERLANLPKAHAWRGAAIADGWSAEPTYAHEPLEHAWRLSREGFVAQGLSRPIPSPDGTMPAPSVFLWGPDGAAVAAPPVYAWEAIRLAVYRCDQCEAFPVETRRYAFANRCCAACGPKFMASLPNNWAA